MTVELSDFKEFIGAKGTTPDALLQDCLNDAAVLISDFVGSVAVPVTILDRCTLVVAQDLWERRNAPNGIVNQQFVATDGNPVVARISRDPMSGAYGLLRKWVLPF